MNDIMAVHILRQLEQQTHLQKRQTDALDRMADALEKLASCVHYSDTGSRFEPQIAFFARGDVEDCDYAD